VTSARSVDVPVDGLVAIMQDAGTGRFIDSLLGFCKTSIGADFVSIFTHEGRGGPSLVGTATTTEAGNTKWAAEGYREHYASDANFSLMSKGMAGAYTTYQTAHDISALRYRRACYERTGIADRLSYLRIAPERSLSVSVYRSRGNGCFSERELDRANALMPLLVAGADLHNVAMLDRGAALTIADAEKLLQSRYPGLTAREREVAARARAGLSARQIGLDLGIAETTVISHRKSAYGRMGLTNLRELTRL
jgi:DNA-binding CsgD family transcriptional regulator